MKANKFKIISSLVLAGIIAITSCVKDLDTIPLDEDVITSASVYKDASNYRKVLAKLYAGLSVSGQIGPHGDNDLSGLDEGFGQYLRAYWYAQELPTDEAIISWNDGNLRDYQEVDWSASNEFITNVYYRIYYQISLCNEFIRESEDSKLDDRGIGGADKTEIEAFRAEARFLRALSYWHALDMFGSVPFVTEDDPVGSFFPDQISKADLFTYIESELTSIDTELPVPESNEYGRVDQAAAWMLLAKLYLNAEVYIGTAKYTECLTQLNKVTAAGYILHPEYDELFLADNDQAEGIIFPITYDGTYTKTWGGTTFLVHAPVGGTMDPKLFGIDGGWGGLRTMKTFVAKFMDVTDLKSGSFSLKSEAAYPVLHVPGGHNGWSETDVNNTLGSVLSDENYEGYIYLIGGEGFKFTVGPSWDRNFGDDDADGTLDVNGANITVADDGLYKINVDTTAKTFTVLKTEWGVIGDATEDAWDSDQNMTYNADSMYLSAILDLTAGSIKFRANDDWTINYGDTGPDGILQQDGDNIAIAAAGKYEIKLKLGAPDYTYSITQFASDGRSMFYTDGQQIDIEDMFEFTHGYAITKWKNVTSECDTCLPAGYDLTHPSTDFPMFRLADAYLMYAECVLRGGSGGDRATALGYVNDVITRAYGGSDMENISDSDLTLDFILDERARELHWEAHRRTDLVRFDKFTSGYTWQWKGGIPAGRDVDDKYNHFPIPDSDIGANPKLKQTDY